MKSQNLNRPLGGPSRWPRGVRTFRTVGRAWTVRARLRTLSGSRVPSTSHPRPMPASHSRAKSTSHAGLASRSYGGAVSTFHAGTKRGARWERLRAYPKTGNGGGWWSAEGRPQSLRTGGSLRSTPATQPRWRGFAIGSKPPGWVADPVGRPLGQLPPGVGRPAAVADQALATATSSDTRGFKAGRYSAAAVRAMSTSRRTSSKALIQSSRRVRANSCGRYWLAAASA